MPLHDFASYPMEALIVENPQWRELFTDAEIAIAEKKLNECGYTPKVKVGSE